MNVFENLRLLGTAILLACLLAGCQANPVLNDASLPLAYRDGYGAGCSSGSAAGGSVYHRHTKDPARAVEDPLYSDGWADGFENCKGRQEATQRLLGPAVQ